MTINEFKKHIEDNKMNWADGEYEGKIGYYVKDENRQIMTEKGMQPACIFIDDKGIEKVGDFKHFRNSCFPDLTYVTRVVGYYSTIHNWNPSKQEELKDRQKGRYCIEG